ncbi:DUF1697 domain-containing protein [Actinokineospora globicatena]|uniref:DUF1697 domain-containing protein n=1 Tax=Actinokineospora globicatena TaxID=103729 RepID=A0A9W6V9K6_9PSEU|nr:DUF1697 domain-containing protein [Actinokineospora globicatena]MCP2301203.1 Uncharacterized conserved protein, DUF1697 family [Actinokineospora globicatena]GLW77161.1 hypothetical protein Aglo01_16430 [Actinokineospora globicatena]GLW83995.1 hypothetical protein Aglo02_16350 [Actinokineospora globicatena]GLW92059.1 hypothetical protein Aglo03_28750 [Actinokineospora globicatena]
MTAYAALLRGVNVGGRAKLPMADLRAVLTGLGYADVRTLLQSGNAVLSTDASAEVVERAVEEALLAEIGLKTRCLVRTGDELRAVLAASPFPEADDGSKMVAAFVSSVPDAPEFDPVTIDPERVRVGDRVIYQWCPDGISNSPLVVPVVEKKWGVAVTARNFNTVTKLAALL